MVLFKTFLLPICTAIFFILSFPGGPELLPLLFIALVPFFIAIQNASIKKSFYLGLFTGIIHYLILLYWIVKVLTTYGGLGWFVALLALLLLVLYMALYFALFGILARTVLDFSPPLVSLLLVPAIWVGLDWFRGVFATGFPWMDIGYALYKQPILLQVADLAGHFCLTYLVVFINVFFFILFFKKKSVSSALVVIFATGCLLGGVFLYSNDRLSQLQQQTENKNIARAKIGIVQGNIDQGVKWSSTIRQATVDKYLVQSERLIEKDYPDFIVWPETALPFYPPSSKNMARLKNFAHKSNVALLTGAPWYEVIDYEAKKVNFYNAAILLEPTGVISGKYYKNHLVPFGEYVPLKKFLPFIAPLVETVGNFSTGVIKDPVTYKGVQSGILICFESVFSDLSRKWVEQGANVLVNLTNDAWYGKSSAPHQSMAMSVLRAVETRRSMVRSANTGISGFVDPTGRIVKSSDIFISWESSSDVVLLEEKTVWCQYGYLFGPVCFLISLMGGVVLMRYGGRRRNKAGYIKF